MSVTNYNLYASIARICELEIEQQCHDCLTTFATCSQYFNRVRMDPTSWLLSETSKHFVDIPPPTTGVR